MSDEKQVIGTNGASESPVEDANLTAFISSLSRAVNETYSYNSQSSLFASLIPAYDRDYAYRYIRPACQWLDGYVPALHDGTSGIMSTRIGNRLITGLTKQIVGEKLIFKLTDENLKEETTLDFVSKWAEKQNIIKPIYAMVGFGTAIGTSLIKINESFKNGEKEYWWESKRFDQCYYLADNQGEVLDAKFFIRAYTDTRQSKDGGKAQFMLVEHRYWKTYDKPEFTDKSLTTLLHKKGDRVPMVCYEIYRTLGTMLRNIPSYQSNKCTWEELPRDIRDMIKTNYSVIRFNEEQQLPFVNLGVEVATNGNIDLSVPTGTGFGESLLVGVQNDMIMYEYAESCLLRDMYLGKGTLYLPKSMSMGDFAPQKMEIAKGGILSEFDNSQAIQLMRGVDPDQQKAIVQQFELRVDEWQSAKENALKDISVKWGMSAKILASYLANSGGTQQTATQIDSEDDMSIAFINLTRSYFLPVINRLLETTLKAYGKINNVSVSFATPSLVNKDRLLDRITKELDAGLINVDEAIRQYNPDASEDEIERKIEIAKVEREKAQQQAQSEFDSFGDMNDNFGSGNNYNDLGGDNLNGSTTPSKDKFNG